MVSWKQKTRIGLVSALLLLSGCFLWKGAREIDYNRPDATKDRPIMAQHKRTIGFSGSGVWMSNEFPGARLNDVYQINDSAYTAVIRPENHPINDSPWYAFKIWADSLQTVYLQLTYEQGTHRYYPQISADRAHWQPLDSAAYTADTTRNTATLRLTIGPDTIWVAAQELFLWQHFDHWTARLAEKPFVERTVLGRSRGGRPIYQLRIGESPEPRSYVLLVSRQHPPEVTGTFALLAFVETICSDSELADQFRRRFAILVVPLMNPDGVTNGHWRHNLGGIDLNRDWRYFNQPETRLVSERFLELRRDLAKRVYFCADFHSTQRDIFYTLPKDRPTVPANFTDRWLDRIQEQVPGYQVYEDPDPTEMPVSKVWFYRTFGAPAITYEVGDNTNRTLIRQVAVSSAVAMMELLLEMVPES